MRGGLLIWLCGHFKYFHHNHLTSEDDLSVSLSFLCFLHLLLSFCWNTMSTSRWISYLQIQETKQRNVILPFLIFLFLLHVCLQSSTRWRWCVPYVTSTLTICTWAGTSPLTMALLLVEPCSTPSSAISMQLKSLSCSFMVSIKRFVSIHAFGAEMQRS